MASDPVGDTKMKWPAGAAAVAGRKTSSMTSNATSAVAVAEHIVIATRRGQQKREFFVENETFVRPGKLYFRKYNNITL